MSIDPAIANIIGPIIGALVGAALTLGWAYYFNRPRLVAYLSSASAHTVRGVNDGPDINIHTHSVIIKNAGKKTTNNIVIQHAFFPKNFNIFPKIDYTHELKDDDTGAIKIPQLVPNEQVTISYLYPQAITWNMIHLPIKSDDGFARELNVLPTPQSPKWIINSIWVFAIIGLASTLFTIYRIYNSLIF